MRKIHISKKMILIPVLLIIVIVGIVIAMWASAPKKGTIGTAPSTRTNQTENYTVKQLDGKFIAFSYSGRYVASTESPQDGSLELYMLRATTTYDKQIAASVAELPDGNLNANGAYLYRQSRTDLYKKRSVEVQGRQIDVLVKSDGTEQTAFLPYGNRVVILAFTTTAAAAQNDNLTDEVNELLKSFRWKA